MPTIWLAPLHGITSSLFRNTLCRHFGGIECFMSPFIAAQPAGKFNENVYFDLFPENNSVPFLVPQLMGKNPDAFLDTIINLHDKFGYSAFNINLGCPSSKVVRHKHGCSLLADIQTVENIVRKVTADGKFNISLKIRLGLKSGRESMDLMARMNDYPLDFVAVHPRLGINLYSGSPDLVAFESLYAISKHKIIYSGDIFSKNDYEKLQTKFPNISDWMLGRGLLRNPFLAEEIKNLDSGDKNARFLAFYDDLVEQFLQIRKPQGVLSQLKELWHYFAFFAEISDEKLREMLRIVDFDEFLLVSKAIISE